MTESRHLEQKDHQPSRQQRRQQRREHATGLLSRYLHQVASALRAEGLAVADVRISPGPDLEAQLRVHPVQPPRADTDSNAQGPVQDGEFAGTQPHNGPVSGAVLGPAHGVEPCELLWAEDTGWHVEHHLLGGPSQATPWRYLHTELVPAPAAVARFAAAVVAGLNDFAGEIGMPYPAQFRFRSQPLGPVLDALAHHATPPSTTNGAVGEGAGEPVTDAVTEVVTETRAKGAG